MVDEYKLDINSYNINKLVIQTSTKTKIGFNSKIKYNDLDFIIQTPVCKVLEIDQDCRNPFCRVSFPLNKNFTHFQFFYGLEEKVLEYIENFKKIESENLRETFVSSLERTENEIILNIKLKPKTLYFDKHKTQIPKYDVKKDNKVILLLDTKGIWIDEISCIMKWNSVQILKIK
jgi:hypothetical protein